MLYFLCYSKLNLDRVQSQYQIEFFPIIYVIFWLQRSASLLNLNLPNLTKFASNIKRKMSDHQHIVLQTPKSNCRPNSHNSSNSTNSSGVGVTTPLTSRQSHFDTSSIRSKTKSGVLYIYLKSRRALQVCIISSNIVQGVNKGG